VGSCSGDGIGDGDGNGPGDGGSDAGEADREPGDPGFDAGADEAPPELPGAPRLLDLGGPIFRYLPYDIAWEPSADDAVRGVVVTHYQVEESKDPTFASGVARLRVDAPATRLSRVKPRPGFGTEDRVTFFYRVRAFSADGSGSDSNVDSKVIQKTWTPEYYDAGWRYPNNPPFELGAGAFTLDDDQANNRRGTFEIFGPGWIHNTDPNKGHLGGYRYVSNYTDPPRDGTEAARWTPTLGNGGKFEVWVSFWRSDNRDTHVEYFVTSLDGAELGPFVLDQRGGSGTIWVKLGEFNFGAGTVNRVDLKWSAAGAAHSESADAAGFKRVPQ
jgi:hypothetical protein